MKFPPKVTLAEQRIKWQKIAEISDQDFGFTDLGKKSNQTRFNTRVLLENQHSNKLCVIRSKKYGFLQIPGGGIEKDETIIEGLRRETEEETGYLIKNIKPLGFFVEHRESVHNERSWSQNISFVFIATTSKSVGTKYMPDEIDEGFTPCWLPLDDIISELEQNEGHIENYAGNFSNRRDLLILKYYNQQKN